jgi:hypothetical protein
VVYFGLLRLALLNPVPETRVRLSFREDLGDYSPMIRHSNLAVPGGLTDQLARPAVEFSNRYRLHVPQLDTVCGNLSTCPPTSALATRRQ